MYNKYRQVDIFFRKIKHKKLLAFYIQKKAIIYAFTFFKY